MPSLKSGRKWELIVFLFFYENRFLNAGRLTDLVAGHENGLPRSIQPLKEETLYSLAAISFSNPGKRLFNSARRKDVMQRVPSALVAMIPAARNASK